MGEGEDVVGGDEDGVVGLRVVAGEAVEMDFWEGLGHGWGGGDGVLREGMRLWVS